MVTTQRCAPSIHPTAQLSLQDLEIKASITMYNAMKRSIMDACTGLVEGIPCYNDA